MSAGGITSMASTLLQPTQQATSPMTHKHHHKGAAAQTDPFAALLGKTASTGTNTTGQSSTASQTQSSGAASMFDLLV